MTQPSPHPAGRPAPLAASRRSWRAMRWWTKALLVLLGLIVLIFLIGEIIFQTSLPRTIVLNAVERELGLRIAARSLSTGWFGHTTLYDVQLSLPLADEPFCDVRTFELHHSMLPMLLFTGKLNIHEIIIDHPNLSVRQDPRGIWNITQVAQLIGRVGGGKTAQSNAASSGAGRIPQIPALRVRDANLTITNNKNQSAQISPISIDGTPQGLLVWQCDANLADHLLISGKIAPGGVWANEFDVSLRDPSAWAQAFLGDSAAVHDVLAGTDVAGHWMGQLSGGQIEGQLRMDNRSRFGPVAAAGAIDFSAGAGSVAVKPRGLTVTFQVAHPTTEPASAPSQMQVESNRPAAAARPGGATELAATLDGGAISLGDGTLTLKRLAVAAFGGRASLDGSVNLADGAASLKAAWRDIAFPKTLTQSGDLTATFTPSLGLSRLSAQVSSAGTLEGGQSWFAQANLEGTGQSLHNATLTLTAPKLVLRENNHQAVSLVGLVAGIQSTPTQVTITDLHLGSDNRIIGHGGYTFASATGPRKPDVGWLTLEAHGWPIPGHAPAALDMGLNVWMNPEQIHVTQLYARVGGQSVDIEGNYVFRAVRPLNLQVYLQSLPGENEVALARQLKFLSGSLKARLDVSGTTHPMNLDILGEAQGRDITLRGVNKGNIDAKMKGSIRNGRVAVDAENVQFLNGVWTIRGHWPEKNALLRLDEISVRGMPLAVAVDENLKGTMDGDWSLLVTEPRLTGIQLHGHAVITGVNYRAGNLGSIFDADRINIAGIDVRDGDVAVGPITVSRTDDEITPAVQGNINLSLSTTLAHPLEVTVDLDSQNFPVRVEDYLATLNAAGHVEADLRGKSFNGSVNVPAVKAYYGSTQLADFSGDIGLDGKTINLVSYSLKTPAGNADGGGSYLLGSPTRTQFALTVAKGGIDLSHLRTLPGAEGLSGTIRAGSFLQLAPAIEPRALGPMALALRLNIDNGSIRGIRFGSLQNYSFITPEQNKGRLGFRIANSDNPTERSYLDAAGGRIVWWVRVAQHPLAQDEQGSIYQVFANVSMDDINLEPIMKLDPKSGRVPGRVDGQIEIIAGVRHPQDASGGGTIYIHHSDLAGTGPIAFLYNLMHFGHDANKPTGDGRIDFTLHRNVLTVTSLRYFDRGAEVAGSAVIGDLTAMPNSPIEATLVGSVRPLKSIDIPGISEVDQALSAVQQSAIAVSITGTVKNYKMSRTPLDAITNGIGGLIFGNVTSETGTQAQ